MMARIDGERTPGFKLLLAILIGFALTIPLFSVWLIVSDRLDQSQKAAASITEGWGGPQSISGPLLVIPYHTTATETVIENGKSVTRSRDVVQEMSLSPDTVELTTAINSKPLKRSIYQAVVYDAQVTGKARFALPPDLARHSVNTADLMLDRAELRFGLSDPRGLGASPRVVADGKALRLQPGAGSSNGGSGFFAWIDAAGLTTRPLSVDFAYDFRGNASLALDPQAGDTRWTVRSTWPDPSFGGDFLPAQRKVTQQGFDASYRIGNLALGKSLVSTGTPGSSKPAPEAGDYSRTAVDSSGASISLIQPVDLYSQVNRATKYGFLFIGFTFLTLLMFDVIAGIRISPVEYLLMGAGLVLFFVLLLAFAEVIGFAPAYVFASVAIAGLNTAYSAAVLKSWRRAWLIGGLLIALYAVLYILLNLEAYSLLIGSLLLFAALAGVMYATRRIDWSGSRDEIA
jgi:inner membrane protein